MGGGGAPALTGGSVYSGSSSVDSGLVVGAPLLVVSLLTGG